MGRKGSRLTEQRLVPFQAARHVAYPYDRPRALHRVSSADEFLFTPTLIQPVTDGLKRSIADNPLCLIAFTLASTISQELAVLFYADRQVKLKPGQRIWALGAQQRLDTVAAQHA